MNQIFTTISIFVKFGHFMRWIQEGTKNFMNQVFTTISILVKFGRFVGWIQNGTINFTGR